MYSQFSSSSNNLNKRYSSSAKVHSNVVSKDVSAARCDRRIVQNFLLVWLDYNFDESHRYFRDSIETLRRVVIYIETFNNSKDCIEFIRTVKNERVFMIVSGESGKKVVPKIQSFPQIELIYVFCHRKAYHEQWANTIEKVKGVYMDIESICESLKVDREHCDRMLISMSFHGIDSSFIYTQILKEALLDIDDDDKSIKELVQFYLDQNFVDKSEIEAFEKHYKSKRPIWWYTSPNFIHSMLNRGLREMDTEIILKLGFFIRQLHNDIQELYDKQQIEQNRERNPFVLYRGQGLSIEDFQKLKHNRGELMSFNNFLSTSRNRQISFDSFTCRAVKEGSNIGILFVMNIDPEVCRMSNIVFVDVSDVGYFKDGEAEVLFTTHTIFRIDNIDRIADKAMPNRLWQVTLTLVENNENSRLGQFTVCLREELQTKRGWYRFGEILIRLGESDKAEYLYTNLLNKNSSIKDRAIYFEQLGRVYDNKQNYPKALSLYEQSLRIRQHTLPPNHPELAIIYNYIGLVYHHMGKYSKALSLYERSLEIKKTTLHPNHQELATSYNNMGLVYENTGEYARALLLYERALRIKKTSLPSNHPAIATSYNNLGSLYINIKEYSKALSYLNKAHAILENVLPPTHPHVISVKKSIEIVQKMS